MTLENITILDLSRLLPGPYCSKTLSDLRANVNRVGSMVIQSVIKK